MNTLKDILFNMYLGTRPLFQLKCSNLLFPNYKHQFFSEDFLPYDPYLTSGHVLFALHWLF